MVDKTGLPIGAQVITANRNDLYACKQVIKEIPKGKELTADRGYDALWFRKYLQERGFVPNIARRSFARYRSGEAVIPGQPPPNPLTYRGRWVVERTFAWLGHFRRLETRYERKAKIYEALWHLACSLLLLRKLTG